MLKISQVNSKLERFPFICNFYIMPPMDQITLFEFETYGLNRLKVLKLIETAKLKYKNDDDCNKYLEPLINQLLPLKRNTLLTLVGPEILLDERRADHIGHFILRLAYCKSLDLRTWFVRQESILFRYRFLASSPAEIELFVQSLNLGLVKMPLHELQKVYNNDSKLVLDLKAIYPHLASWDGVQPLFFYKTHFANVTELVARRTVLILDGFALVPESELIVLVVNAFKANLMAALEMTAQALPRLDEEDRLMPILHSLSKQYLSQEPSFSQHGDITHDQIAKLSSIFPPCMQSLQIALERDSHLKHTSRLHFGLFLKGIGLSLEEALIFWRKAFNRMSDDEFTKKGYTYNIRYNYGMEGKRTNYTPYSCARIIMDMPGPNDTHGCPFRHFQRDKLTTMLHNMRVKESSIVEINRLAAESHYQLACTQLFEATHGKVHMAADEKVMGIAIEHPNQWFDLAYKKNE
jgi:DNA primase large subunit